MSVLTWRSTSWIHNIWTSSVLAVVSAQILWIAIGFGYGFDTAARLGDEYLWYVVGLPFTVFLTIRIPRSSRPAGEDTKPRAEPDA